MKRWLTFFSVLLLASGCTQKPAAVTFQEARALYEKAVEEERQEETHVQSFTDYLQSLWITDGLCGKRRVFNLRESNPEYEHFTGMIYDRLAWFLYNYEAWDVAMECLERSNQCFEKEGNLEGIASNYDLMGDIMLAQENRLGSVKYYKESDSISMIVDNGNERLNFNGRLHRGIILSSMGDKEGAKAWLLEGLENSDQPWRTRRLHFGLGYVYSDLQEYDSALYHYERSYPLLPRQTAKSYCRIIQLATQLGQTDKAAEYGKMLADYYANQSKKSGAKTRMVTLYENYKADSKEAHNKDLMFFIILIVIVLTLVIVFDSVFIEKRRRHHKKEIEQHERIKASLENEIEKAQRLSNRKEQKIKDLESKLNQIVNNPDFQNLPFEQKMETLMAMPICKRVISVKDVKVKAGVAYPELVLSQHQLSSLVKAVDAVFPKFSSKIIDVYPRINHSDVVYCCMYILGITEVQAAALTGKTYQAVWARSLKLHEVFDNKSNLQLVLMDFLQNW